MSLALLLSIIFMVLKLCGVIAWSWWLVATPLLVVVLLYLVLGSILVRAALAD